MATFDATVVGSPNDAYETGDGFFVTNTIWLHIYPIADSDTGSNFYRSCGIRFTAITIPQGATINVASVQLRNRLANGIACHIYAEDVDNAVAFNTNPTIYGRTQTAANVAWAQDFTNATYQQSPDIAAVIQEVVDRPGWVSGNALVLLFIAQTNFGGDIGDMQEEFAAVDNGAVASPAMLHVEYTVGGQTFNVDIGGSITPGGTLVKQVSKTLAGAVVGSGTLVKQVGISVAGIATLAGTVTRQVHKSMAAVVGSVGTLTKDAGKLLAGQVTFTGLLVKITNVSLSGSVSTNGGLTKRVAKVYTGIVGSSGGLVRSITKQLTGSNIPGGTLVKRVTKDLVGTVGTSGVVSAGKTILLFLSGTISSTGVLTKQVHKTFTGLVPTGGTLVKQVRKVFVGTVSLAGAVQNTGGGTVQAVRALFKGLFKGMRKQ